MISVIRGKPFDSGISSGLAKKVHDIIDFDNIKAEGIQLSGSHMVGTDNKYSDFDITLYYAYYLGEILNVEPSEIFLTDNGQKYLDKTSGRFKIDGTEYEINTVPILSRKIPANELAIRLLANDTHTLLRLVMGEEIMCNTKFKILIESILNDYTWDKDKIFKFSQGYSSSSLDKANLYEGGGSDGSKMAPALHISKNLIHGLYYGLNGISLLNDESVYVKMDSLMERFAQSFDDEILEFINQCIQRKRTGKKITGKVQEWIKESTSHIETIQSFIDEELNSALKKTHLISLTGDLQRKNKEIINEYLFLIYDQEVDT